MKNIGLMAILLSALMFVGCDNNEVQNNQTSGELGVMPFNSSKKPSRGYTLGATFNETAFENLHKDPAPEPTYRDIHLSGWLTQHNGIQREYFKDKLFRKDVVGEFWRNWENEKYDPIYWPIGGTMDFLAYSSTSEEGTLTAQWGENPAERLRIDVQADNMKNDILFASAEGITSSKDGGCVNLDFKHSQAWIEFVLTSSAGSGTVSEEAIKFEKLELDRIFNAGKLEIHNNRGDALGSWNFCGMTPQNVIVSGDDIEYINSTAQFIDVLIPQQQQTSFTLYYSLSGNPEAGLLDYTFVLPVGTTWFMGAKYVYNIHYSVNELTVTPAVVEWESEGLPEVDLY